MLFFRILFRQSLYIDEVLYMLIAGDWAAELWLAAGIGSSTISMVVIFLTGACLLWRHKKAAKGTPDACSLCTVIFTDAPVVLSAAANVMVFETAVAEPEVTVNTIAPAVCEAI